ncbi:MAG TPA: GNAT family N-acetyltransferase [Candidatus Dormibacteraeota bacterium]|nr:GNAT family N-acetyltransferase [Candidatus Dormibacteraeota bacterium]
MDRPPAPGPGDPTRLATPADATELTRLRARLLAGTGAPPGDGGWQAACTAYLRRALADGTVVGAVVDGREPGALVATGLVALRRVAPGPRNPRGQEAYVYSMYTESGWRRRGLARAILQRLLAEVGRRGIAVVELHATAQGEPLYASLGFRPRPEGRPMRLVTGAYPGAGGSEPPPAPVSGSPAPGK